MGAARSFTPGNYHCKRLRTDVIVFHMADVTVIYQVIRNSDLKIFRKGQKQGIKHRANNRNIPLSSGYFLEH